MKKVRFQDAEVPAAHDFTPSNDPAKKM